MRKSNRRGVLLLIVLALLAMFAVVSVAFVLLTGQYRSSSDRLRMIGVADSSPEKTLQQGFNVVARGPNINTTTPAAMTSAITWQSLLEKIYGDTLIGPATLKNVSPVCNGQLIEFTLPTTVDPFRWVGCVVTMLSGRNAGLSSRIVGVDPMPNKSTTPPTYNVQMAAFDGGTLPANNDQYIVNGFPYNGMGFGFNISSGSLTQTNPIKSGVPLALTPNAPPTAWGLVGGIMPGGVNSDCTVPDYTDPLLALAVPSPSTGGISVPIPSLHRADLLASFGTAASVASDIPSLTSQTTWVKWAGDPSTQNAALLRQMWFRPSPVDHPAFCNSVNPSFNPIWDGFSLSPSSTISWQWDVDNDGDGIPDSVWVDLGMPVRYTSDGQAYKPLFAILCLDLDSRLNLNAHGSLAQTNTAYYSSQNVQLNQTLSFPQGAPGVLDTGIGKTPTATAYFAAPAGTSIPAPQLALPRGQGTGTAEVNLLPLFRNPLSPASWPSNFYLGNYQAMLSGNGALMGRYGPAIGYALPGLGGTGSFLTLNNSFPYNGNYWTNFQSTYDAFGSPPDPQTIGAVGLDRAGRPLYISMGGQVANGPYDVDLTRNAAHAVTLAKSPQDNLPDDPFGVAELERILRCYDRDVGALPQRLANLTDNGYGSILQSRRAEVTTESWSVPVSSGVLPYSLRTKLPGNRSFHPVDILTAALKQNNVDPYSNGVNLNSLRTQLLPWEILQGLKMDLNRPFGVGALTTATNGSMIPGFARPNPAIPDQPGTTGEQIQQYTNTSGTLTTATFNYSADAGLVSQITASNTPAYPVNDSLAARQLYARHLYVLAMALSDSGAIAKNLHSTPGNEPEDVARLLAQWAVNVVAYRDHNGIMIPFPYDVNPFSGNGWNPDNTLAHTVWGCKRPELLITETLAFHDRRTQDLADEVLDKNKPNTDPTIRTKPGLTTDTDQSKHDPSFNSKFRPQGSLFVELYNPWMIVEPRTSDLSLADPVTGVAGVHLNKMTPQVNGKQSPVWRLVIVDPKQIPLQANGDELPDPDSPILANRPTIERAAYFVSLTGGAATIVTPGDGQVSYCLSNTNTANTTPLVVAPSGYAVIGSGDINQSNRTFIGFENGKTAGDAGTTRMVTLNPADLTDARVVRNTADLVAIPPPPVGPPIPKVLGIDSPQRLSISEPTKGYVPYEVDGSGVQQTPDPTTGQYPVTLDIPVDQQREILQPDPNPASHEQTDKIWTKYLYTNGTFPAFRILYLQRLADPTRPFVSDVPGSPTYDKNPQQWNPYRTVDAMTVDLTTFNGVSDPAKTEPNVAAWNGHFEARQRGERNYLPGNPPVAPSPVGEANLWKQEPAIKSLPSPGPAWTPAGWVNGGVAPTAASCNFDKLLNQTLGYLNQSFGTAASSPPGDSQYPFPWLNWSYRPFNNEYELLLVPTVSSSRLLARNTTDARRNFNYVDQKTRTAINGGAYQTIYETSTSDQVPYPHLLNFFESAQSSKPGTSTQLHRLFAYVGVPSKFANTQLQMQAYYAGLNSATNPQAPAPPHYFHTPFNRISKYREPGRINLNTMTSPDVLFGGLNMYFPSLQQNTQLNPVFWDKFVRSRRGDGAGTVVSNVTPNPSQQTLNNMLQINVNAPSRFTRPYRTPGGEILCAPKWDGSSTEPSRETDVTLLRTDLDVLSTSGSTERPMFELDDYLMGTSSSTSATPDNFATDVQAYKPNGLAFMDFNRNPYFRYQPYQKLGSVFSNHSNVFAVWITVGYFQVTPVANPGLKDPAGNPVYPDGFQLGQELGSDTGDAVRHRAFYIFDRSIPVGFIRGKDINQDKAVLLKRFIE